MIKLPLFLVLTALCAAPVHAGEESEAARKTAPAPAKNDEAAREKTLRAAVDNVLTLSDEDYRDFIKGAAPQSRWAKEDRATFLSTSFRSLAARRRRLAAAEGLTKAGRELDDAKAAGPDKDLIQETGWWSDASAAVNSYVNAPAPRQRGPAIVAAVRGGRKLSTEQDKEVTRLLAAADAGNHLEAAKSYDALADIFGAAPAPTAAAPAAPAAPVAKTLSAKEIYQKTSPSVVLILAAEREGAGGELGTGSVIEGGRVLTNAHVVINDKTGRPYSQVRVYLKPAQVSGDTKRDLKNPIVATVARFDRALDLALLEPQTRLSAGPLALGDDSTVEPGDPVVAIGHPEQGGLWTLTQGVISTVVADLGGVPGKDAFQTDASINRGNSGGPLIDRTGSLVGVNTSMARKAADGLTITSVNFSVKASVAKRWIGGDSSSVAAAPAQPAPAEAPAVAAVTPKAAAPLALPPPPKTKPVVVTPAAPYRIDDVIETEMKEMEDLEGEMQREIQSRRAK